MKNAALLSGLLSAGLYVAVFTLGLGFLFLFLPSLPIFWLGLTKRADPALHAGLLATVFLALLLGPISALFYLLIIALPAWYIAQQSSKSGMHAGHVVWFPFTVIVARLSAAFVSLLLVASIYYADKNGGLGALVSERIREATLLLSNEIDEKTLVSLQTAAQNYSFLVFALFAWMWVACLYLHAWAVSRELVRQKKAVRPHMDVGVFPPPNWMISLLLIAALASFIGSPWLAFWGKTSMLVLFLPYFLLGLALVHNRTKKLPNRGVLLFCMYIVLSLVPWAVLFMAAYGLMYHIQIINKYLSSGGNSTKS